MVEHEGEVGKFVSYSFLCVGSILLLWKPEHHSYAAAVVVSRAEESESRPELESVGVDHFAWSRSLSWSRQNFADSDFGPSCRIPLNIPRFWTNSGVYGPENMKYR